MFTSPGPCGEKWCQHGSSGAASRPRVTTSQTPKLTRAEKAPEEMLESVRVTTCTCLCEIQKHTQMLAPPKCGASQCFGS